MHLQRSNNNKGDEKALENINLNKSTQAKRGIQTKMYLRMCPFVRNRIPYNATLFLPALCPRTNIYKKVLETKESSVSYSITETFRKNSQSPVKITKNILKYACNKRYTFALKNRIFRYRK